MVIFGNFWFKITIFLDWKSQKRTIVSSLKLAKINRTPAFYIHQCPANTVYYWKITLNHVLPKTNQFWEWREIRRCQQILQKLTCQKWCISKPEKSVLSLQGQKWYAFSSLWMIKFAQNMRNEAFWSTLQMWKCNHSGFSFMYHCQL